MVSFAAALGIGAKAYVGFNALPEVLRGTPRMALQILMHLAVVALMGTMLWYSFGFVRVGGLRTAATLGIRMSYVHASMCLLAASAGLCALLEIARVIVEHREGEDAR
jgi:TRAP-type C4-dicarboxylate transport system permease small subunit